MSSHDFPMEQTTSTGSMTRSNSMVVSPTTTTSPPTGMQRRSSLPAATVKRAGRDERFTQTDIRDLIWGVEWEADPALRRSKESILPLDTDIIVAPHHSTSQSYSTMAMQRRTSDDDDDGEGTTGPSGPPSQKVIGLPSTDECIFLRAAHHRVRQFMSLIQVWLEDPKKLDFVGEWVGQQHPSRVGEHFRQQAEDEDTLLAALKEEMKHVMRSSEVSAEEKIERCRVFADRQKMIFLKRAERQKESDLLLAEHHRSTFIRMNTLTIEGDEEEHDASFVGAEELANSIVAHLGKFFVFVQSAVEQTQVIPSGAELLSLQLFPGGVRQKTIYGLQSGLHNELDAVLMPRDFEELKLIVKGNELPDLYKLKYTEKWDFGADELEYLREKFLKQYAAEELRKIQQTSKKKKDETMSALNKELGKMRASATQQIKELEDSVNTAAAITARQQRSRQNSSAPSSAGGAHSVIPPSPRPSGSLVTSGEVSPVTPSLSPAPLQTQLTRPGSSGIGKPPISPAVPFMAGGSVSNVEWFPVIPATPQATSIHVDENAATLAFQALAAGERPVSASGSALSTGRGGGANEASSNSEASECLKAAVGAAISPRDAPLVAAATKPPASSKLPQHQDTHGSSGPHHHHALARQKSSLAKQPSGVPPSAILAPGASSNGPSSELSPSQAALTGWVDQQQIMSNNGNLLGSTVAAEVRDGDGSTRGQGRDLAVIGSVSSFRRPLQREASSVKNVATKIKSALHLRNGASTGATTSQEKSTSHQRDSSSNDPFAVPISQPQLSGAPASHTTTTVPNTSAVSELTADTKTAAAAASLAHAREQLTAVVDTLMTTQPSRSRRHLTSSLRGTVASAPTSLLGLGDTSLAADLQLQQLQQQNASDTRPQKKLYVANAKSSDAEGGRVDYVVSPARRGSSPSSPLNRQIEGGSPVRHDDGNSPHKRQSPQRARPNASDGQQHEDIDPMIRFGKPLPRGVTVMDADPLASLSQKVAHRRDLVTPTVSSSHQRKHHQLPPRASTPQQLPVTSTIGGGGRSSAPNKLQPLRAATTGSGAVTGPPPNTTSGIARMVLPVRNSAAVKYNEEIEAHAVANTTSEQLMVEAMLHGRLDRLHLLVSPVLPSRSDDSRVSPERRSPLRGEHVQLDHGVYSSGRGEDAEEADFGTAVNAIDVPLGSSRTQPLPNKNNEMVYGSKAADVPCLIPTRSQQRNSKPPTPSQHQQRGINNNNMMMATTTVIGQTTIDPPLSSRNIFAAQPLIHTALQQKQQHRAIGHQQSQQDVDTVGGPGRVAPHNGSVEFNYDEHQHQQQQHNGGGQFWDSSEHGALHRHQEHHAGHHESYASSYPYMSPIGASYNNNGNNNSLASQQQQPQQHRRTHTFADHVATVRGGGAAAAAAVVTPPAGSISPFPASTRVLHGSSNSAPSQTAVQQQHQQRADGGVDKHHNAFSGATNDFDADGYGEFVHYAVAVDGARGGQRLTVAKPEFSYLA